MERKAGGEKKDTWKKIGLRKRNGRKNKNAKILAGATNLHVGGDPEDKH